MKMKICRINGINKAIQLYNVVASVEAMSDQLTRKAINIYLYTLYIFQVVYILILNGSCNIRFFNTRLDIDTYTKCGIKKNWSLA